MATTTRKTTVVAETEEAETQEEAAGPAPTNWASLFVVANTLVDIVYGWIDPRISQQ